VRLSSLRGQPVVLEFWASWCETCKRALPDHEKLARAYAGRLQVWAVNVGEDPETAASYVRHRGMTLPVLVDPEGKAATSLGMDAMPYAVLLDAEGRVAARVAGEPYPSLRQAVERILAPAPGGPGEVAPPRPSCQPVTREGVAMGTQVRVVVCPREAGAVGESEARRAAEAGFAEFARLEGLWTTWRATSDVSKVNAAAGTGRVVVAPETLAVLQAAQHGTVQSSGLFDVTFAPLGEVWQFDTPPGSHEPTHLARVPSPEEIRSRLARVGAEHLHVEASTRTVWLDRAGAAIHLGGIGKGAAVDRVVAELRRQGFQDFAVQAGGDLYCGGHNGNRPWRVGIAHPRQKGALLGMVEVTDAAFSTSGDYERFAILDGHRYHHILDPRTGMPGTASQSATVLASSATVAEVETKTAFLLGGTEGLAWLQRNGARGVVVDASGHVWQSVGLTMVAP
jgi:thiamine biosynthesis lipoprotein